MQTSDTKFGITLVLPGCGFVAELHRESIPEMMKDIDDKLTEQGTPDEPETRCELMFDNALMLSSMIATDEIDQASGVHDIAYSFLYAFGMVIGFDQMDTLRGLTGTYLHNHLNLNPCLGEDEYQKETAILRQKMADHGDNGDWDVDIPPTVH